MEIPGSNGIRFWASFFCNFNHTGSTNTSFFCYCSIAPSLISIKPQKVWGSMFSVSTCQLFTSNLFSPICTANVVLFQQNIMELQTCANLFSVLISSFCTHKPRFLRRTTHYNVSWCLLLYSDLIAFLWYVNNHQLIHLGILCFVKS